MKKVLLFFMLFSVVASTYGTPTRIYVSPKGSDTNEGTRRAPFASLSAAVAKVNQMRSYNTRPDDNVEIIIEEGCYEISEPINFSPGISRDNVKLTIKGAGMGKTILSGGIELPPFNKNKNTGLWEVTFDNRFNDGLFVYQLFVNDRRAILARTPNCDKYFVPLRAEENEAVDSPNLYHQTVFLPSEAQKFIGNLKSSDEIFVSILHYWDFTRKKAEAINYNVNNVSITGPSVQRWNYFKNATQLFLENDMSFLDEPGEFYYDWRVRTLYYYPRPEDILQETRAIVPLTETILNFKGDDENAVRNITIKDLTIANTLYSLSTDGENPQQAVASKGASVMLDYSENIVFSNCEFCHIGLYGIWFREACVGCKIENSYIHDLGAGGVKIGENKYIYSATPTLTRNIVVNNNIICEGGRTLPPAVGVILFNASDCQITHNDIFDFYYTGVSVGWSWGYSGSPSKRNTISYNHIHHIGWGGLSDMGGIYTLGVSEGTIISNNIIHDVYAYGPDGVGIYADEGTSGILIKDNIVYNCKSAGFAQHYGRNNRVINNVFANNIVAQLSIGTANQNDNTLYFNNNIVYSATGGQIFPNDSWGNYAKVEADSNVYWIGGEENIFNKKNLASWINTTRKDLNSIVADPKLVIKTEKDIRVTNKTVMRMISFKPIELLKIGVQGDKNWKKFAKMDPEREKIFEKITGANKRNENSNETVSFLNKKEVVLILLAGLTASGLIGGKLLLRNKA